MSTQEQKEITQADLEKAMLSIDTVWADYMSEREMIFAELTTTCGKTPEEKKACGIACEKWEEIACEYRNKREAVYKKIVDDVPSIPYSDECRERVAIWKKANPQHA